MVMQCRGGAAALSESRPTPRQNRSELNRFSAALKERAAAGESHWDSGSLGVGNKVRGSRESASAGSAGVSSTTP